MPMSASALCEPNGARSGFVDGIRRPAFLSAAKCRERLPVAWQNLRLRSNAHPGSSFLRPAIEL